MMKEFVRFNIYFCMALALLFLATGCHSSEKKKKDQTIIELHQEVVPDGASDNKPVQIFREHPIYVNVDVSPFVDTPDVEGARVIDDNFGGFMIQLKFNWRGTQLLNSITTANRGKRIAVFAQFPQARWLASPMVERPISDGVFTFTPDATREEADRIVKGLNAVVGEMKKKEKL